MVSTSTPTAPLINGQSTVWWRRVPTMTLTVLARFASAASPFSAGSRSFLPPESGLPPGAVLPFSAFGPLSRGVAPLDCPSGGSGRFPPLAGEAGSNRERVLTVSSAPDEDSPSGDPGLPLAEPWADGPDSFDPPSGLSSRDAGRSRPEEPAPEAAPPGLAPPCPGRSCPEEAALGEDPALASPCPGRSCTLASPGPGRRCREEAALAGVPGLPGSGCPPLAEGRAPGRSSRGPPPGLEGVESRSAGPGRCGTGVPSAVTRGCGRVSESESESASSSGGGGAYGRLPCSWDGRPGPWAPRPGPCVERSEACAGRAPSAGLPGSCSEGVRAPGA